MSLKLATNALHAGHDVEKHKEQELFRFINPHPMY